MWTNTLLKKRYYYHSFTIPYWQEQYTYHILYAIEHIAQEMSSLFKREKNMCLGKIAESDEEEGGDEKEKKPKEKVNFLILEFIIYFISD